MDTTWVEGFPGAVTVCDAEGTITAMNGKAREVFAEQGGGALVGQSLLACHNPRSQAVIRELLASGRTNTYTIEKRGRRKLIHQAPWYLEGKVAGLVEISVEIPRDLPHFVRG
jgi:transcriptional regulator with PAS, ATPase and Fis domain